MKVDVSGNEEGMSEFLYRVLKSKEDDNVITKVPKEQNEKQKDNSIDVIKIRQLEQKQELLVGLTNLLFKKFEEMHPTKKFSKFEFTDISWYKKLGTAQ
ncbi:MAG: hypothetical protein H2B03_06475 [Nitrosopumilaceae archaeon]|jgi:hypothetical protein|uniref:Uncharacterized protein n=1 Tax=Candidatus Nitrosomaritimum aestuariumsis TaxID=3342354 RepID=A0AC60VZB6_9ARCH|nr:hypothetical protein [Nitrosopumilaceae archaeon]